MNTVCKNKENSKSKGKEIHPSFRGIIAEGYNLSSLSSFQVGGEAKLFIEPFSLESLVFAIDYLQAQESPFFILGGISNLVISDEGIPIPVLSTRSLQAITLLKEQSSQGELLLCCEAGASVASIIDYCIKEGLTGLEEFAGLPGRIGGAVFMNARCYGLSIADRIEYVEYIDCDAIPSKAKSDSSKVNTKALFERYNFDASDWDYKKSPFQANKKLIVEVVLRVEKADTQNIAKKASIYFADREKKGHYKFPSAGSVFKNNRAFGKPSGKIIDEAGLRGLQIGGAQVAPWHGNFIINTGTATAKDIKALVLAVQKSVKEQFGFDLEPEILFSDSLL